MNALKQLILNLPLCFHGALRLKLRSNIYLQYFGNYFAYVTHSSKIDFISIYVGLLFLYNIMLINHYSAHLSTFFFNLLLLSYRFLSNAVF